ncbi:MAG: hypothetical protein ACRDS0_15205 [Pseudonocardiaceae bacterium]
MRARASEGTRDRHEQTERRPETRPRLISPDVASLLKLQSSVGNTNVTKLVARQAVDAPTVGGPAPLYKSWTRAEIRPIQRELRRLRLYNGSIDGALGPVGDQGLVEAFGGNEWRTLNSATVLTRLKAATRPRKGSGHDFRYGELFKDGLLDVTFGFGFMEELDAAGWAALTREMETALTSRGYQENKLLAVILLALSGGRTPNVEGRFFVKTRALVYQPPAGPPRPIHAIVRFLANPTGARGAETRAAFEQGMTEGDVAYYSGHGRYGSGPDFDRNFGKFTLRDRHGSVEQVIDDYSVLEHVLSREGDPWTRFEWRFRNHRLTVEFSNLGNLRLNARNLHPREFGAKLIHWAMDQTGTAVETGRGGALDAAAASHPEHKYRVLVFDGCRTQDYETSIRATPGFSTRSTDIIGARREVGFGAEVEAFVAFLDGIVGQQSPEEVAKGMNEEMKSHEGGYSGAPFKGSGLEDNPSR